MQFRRSLKEDGWKMIDPKAKLLERVRFANPSPPSGWVEDFHLQAVDHARHTSKTPAGTADRG
jgi:hypothetical protein